MQMHLVCLSEAWRFEWPASGFLTGTAKDFIVKVLLGYCFASVNQGTSWIWITDHFGCQLPCSSALVYIALSCIRMVAATTIGYTAHRPKIQAAHQNLNLPMVDHCKVPILVLALLLTISLQGCLTIPSPIPQLASWFTHTLFHRQSGLMLHCLRQDIWPPHPMFAAFACFFCGAVLCCDQMSEHDWIHQILQTLWLSTNEGTDAVNWQPDTRVSEEGNLFFVNWWSCKEKEPCSSHSLCCGIEPLKSSLLTQERMEFLMSPWLSSFLVHARIKLC